MACGAERPNGSGAASSVNVVERPPGRPSSGTLREGRPLTSNSPASGFPGWPTILGGLIEGDDLSREVAAAALGEVLSGRATPAQIAGWIVAMRIKGEAVDELVGLVDAMMAAAEPMQAPAGAIDIVGTGGAASRRKHALSVSTMASFVAAGAGVTVCKHGNLRASATSGSFDTLNALGINYDLGAAGVLACMEQVGIGFAFARRFHPSVRHAGPVRTEIGIPTLFNVLGPLANPGRVTRQVVGTSDPRLARRMAEVLAARGAERAWVVHGSDGLDEITTTGSTAVVEVADGRISEWELHPGDVGIATAAPDELAGGGPEDNARLLREIFGGAEGPRTDIVALNAAAGLVVAGTVVDLAAGLVVARETLASGAAMATVEKLVAVSAGLS